MLKAENVLWAVGEMTENDWDELETTWFGYHIDAERVTDVTMEDVPDKDESPEAYRKFMDKYAYPIPAGAEVEAISGKRWIEGGYDEEAGWAYNRFTGILPENVFKRPLILSFNLIISGDIYEESIMPGYYEDVIYDIGHSGLQIRTVSTKNEVESETPDSGEEA